MTEAARPHTAAEINPLPLLVRVLLIAAGLLFFALGMIGIVLPILPTTPFMLLAAAAFVRSSDKLYRWLLASPFVNRHFHSLLNGAGLTLKQKLFFTGIAGVMILFSAVVVVHTWPLRLLLLALWGVQIAYFASIKTAPPTPNE